MLTSNEAIRYLMEGIMNMGAKELRQSVSDLDGNFKFNFGAWSNDAGIVTGYISILPHGNPAEQSIDAVISFVPSEGKAYLSADICWSDGTILIDIAEKEIILGEVDELLLNTKLFCQGALTAFLKELPELVINKKYELPKS